MTQQQRTEKKRKLSAKSLETAARHGEALELRKAGASFEAIAKKLGYSNRSSAYRAIESELKRTVTEPAADLLKLEAERLNRLRLAHWNAALAGDIDASKIILQIGQREAKLFGLDDYERRMAEVAERRQALEEGQALLVAQAVIKILGRLDLTDEQQAKAREVAPEELRQITA